LLKFSGILRGKKNKAAVIGIRSTQPPPPVSQELAWMRLVLFYHKIGSLSPFRPTLAQVKELDFAYLHQYTRVGRTNREFSHCRSTYVRVTPYVLEARAMTETEQELLSRLLINLFLESPKKTRVHPKSNEKQTSQQISVAASKTRKQPGGTKDVR
jgi:hypothetical protein